MTMSNKIGMMNIIAPLKISPISNSGAAPRNTKQFIPIGGVIIASSMSKTIITPNQIKSSPIILMSGKIIGIVITTIASASIIAPRTRYIRTITANKSAGGMSKPFRKSANKSGIFVIVKK